MLRVKELREKKGLQQKELSFDLGVSQPTISDWESGRKIPSAKSTLKLAEYFNVSVDYLLGRDESGHLSEVNSKRFSSPNIASQEDVVTFYPIGTVAAGYGEIAFEELIDDPIDVPVSYLKGRPKSDYFLLRVTGDSMYPLYHEGDHVLVLRQDTLNRSGEIGVVLYAGEQATLKKVEYVMGEDWMRLVPINPIYKELLVENADLEQCRVLGIPRVLIREL